MTTRNKTKTNRTHLFDNDVLEMIEELRKDRTSSINQTMNDIVREAYKQMKRRHQDEVDLDNRKEVERFMFDLKDKLKIKEKELSEVNDKLMVLMKSNEDFKKNLEDITKSNSETAKRLDRHSSRLNKIEDESKKGFLEKLKGG